MPASCLAARERPVAPKHLYVTTEDVKRGQERMVSWTYTSMQLNELLQERRV